MNTLTTITYTVPTTTTTPLTTDDRALIAFNKINAFLNVFFDAAADHDCNFRGLDLNCNAMWATKQR
jgi:hypothetical protein